MIRRAPAAASWPTWVPMLVADAIATPCMVACAVAGVAAAPGIAWKMLLAPPQSVAVSVGAKAPPRSR